MLKAGDASTLDVVDNIRAALPRVATTLPPELKVDLLADQSIFVRGAITGVIHEAIIAACLTALMILLFLGSWRSTLIIAVSIPLSILTSVIVLSFLGETINIMTLGGLALAVGILVDDATVTIENIERYLEEGRELREAILEGAAQIAVPALVSTLCICIVFLPMFFLSGVARYLFVPLAEAVVFAMLASYVLSRTLVPTLAMYLLRRAAPPSGAHPQPASRCLQRGFERGFERLRAGYRGLLDPAASPAGRLRDRRSSRSACARGCLLPWLGENFFPTTDNGQFILHLRAKTGTRIEETARLADLVEAAIRREIPAERARQHHRQHRPAVLDHQLHVQPLRLHRRRGRRHPGHAQGGAPAHRGSRAQPARAAAPGVSRASTFYFVPADIVTQILNFGLPAPIDVQIEGNDIEGNRQVANRILDRAAPRARPHRSAASSRTSTTRTSR